MQTIEIIVVIITLHIQVTIKKQLENFAIFKFKTLL